jgi:hypothetical protein
VSCSTHNWAVLRVLRLLRHRQSVLVQESVDKSAADNFRLTVDGERYTVRCMTVAVSLGGCACAPAREHMSAPVSSAGPISVSRSAWQPSGHAVVSPKTAFTECADADPVFLCLCVVLQVPLSLPQQP